MGNIFKRYEKKYLVTREQGCALQEHFLQHMEADQYGSYLVQNLYFDTENWDAIRESVAKPVYKEKMRLRCYGLPKQGTDFFLELKKKYKGIVYKRRIAIPAVSLTDKTVRDAVSAQPSQIARELEFYMKSNAVSEKVYIAYHRIALAGAEDEGLRVTFDTDICFRTDCLDFRHPYVGVPILPRNNMLMEIKTLGGMPMWMTRILSENKIYPAAFSKYGACYTDHILGQSEITRMVRYSA
ncbi:MAG: polyphosphate polymerase domain-containing protein [Oscillospiraceae bacterium]|jgi:SPX domain protein involved in polyphosphate accumulation|nr:polyphosphate polymerase domain-containing protein [Oscillospiraceae bacterium]